MILRRALLGLPTVLLLFARVQAEDGHELDDRQEQAQQSLPWAVRKMSLDPSEKFFPEQYFGFAAASDGDSSSQDNAGSSSLSGLYLPGRRRLPALAADGPRDGHWPLAVRDAPPSPPPPPPPPPPPSPPTGNASVAETAFFQTYLPPFSVHHRIAEPETAGTAEASDADDAAAAATWHRVRRAARDVLDRLQRRQWGCPSGTASCSSIGYPYSCCGTDETCYLVTDTGLGPVGCCPSGSSCSGSISDCGSGSSACAADLGGGCCIAGYVCQGVGCVVSASTATTTSTAVAQPSTTVVTVVVTGGAGSITTRTTTITTTPSPSTTTITSTAVAGSSGVAPVKPTLTATATTTSPTTTPTLASGSCPAGYYGCLATAGGGCCQTGRDCKTTGCAAAAASTTIVDAGGVTVVVPATDATATAVDTCANGWFLCGADAGAVAGCCPSGYACGTASCTLASASSTSTGVVQKELPGTTSSGSGRSAAQNAVAGWRWLAAAGWLGWLLL